MRSTTATRTSTDSAEAMPARPRIGLLGIMQALYDDMLPGITERQAAYAAEVAAALGDDADVTVAPPVKTREDADRALRELEAADLDGVIVVMLTYGPAMHVARALAGTSLPLCLANIQPVAAVTPASYKTPSREWRIRPAAACLPSNWIHRRKQSG